VKQIIEQILWENNIEKWLGVKSLFPNAMMKRFTDYQRIGETAPHER
jgi:hypothetical protein